MTTTRKFNPETRKALAKALGEILQIKPKYLGVPSCAYQIGDYNLAKDGTLTGPELSLNMQVALLEKGFEPEITETFHFITPRGTLLCQQRFDTAEEAEAAGYSNYFHHQGRDVYTKDSGKEHCPFFAVVGAPFEEAAAELEEPAAEPEAPEADEIVIEYPHRDFTPEKLDNLYNMIEAKAPLLKKALGTDFLNITMDDTKLGFPWFRATEDNGQIDAYAQFIAALCQTALKKQRVTARAPEFFENERFAMRVWLISLGMVGPEFATARRALCKNLSGDSAFRYGKPAAMQGETPAPQAEGEEGEVNE